MRPVTKKVVAAAFAIAAVASFAAPARAVGRVELQVGRFALEQGVFNTVFAKELCSCVFVDGLTREECQARDNLPSIAHSLVNISIDPRSKTVTSGYKGRETIDQVTRSIGLGTLVHVGGPASARFDEEHPELGCVLTKLPDEP